MKTLFAPVLWFALLGAYALAALLAALISQYGFGLPPCELCIYQRVPYVLIAVVAGLALTLHQRLRALRLLLLLCGTLYLADAGIAAYHAGVEWGYFEGLSGCSAGELPPGATLEDMRRQLMEAPVVSCKDAMFVFLGLSMAGWTALYAMGGVILCVIAWRRLFRKGIA